MIFFEAEIILQKQALRNEKKHLIRSFLKRLLIYSFSSFLNVGNITYAVIASA